MKYQRLSKEQFEELHYEFALFLASQSIDQKKWTQIKSENKQWAEQQLDLFSDMVWEKVLQKVNYLEKIEPHWIFLFKCTETKMFLIAIQSKNKNTDLSSKEAILWLSNNLKHKDIEVFTCEKSYQADRNTEIFNLITQGTVISNGELFNSFHNIIS